MTATIRPATATLADQRPAWRALDQLLSDDTCECGGCDTCIPRKLAAELRRLADEGGAS